MPTYVYRCSTCDDDFEIDRPMSQSGDPATCPSGHTKTMRKLTAFASVSTTNTTPCGAPAAAAPAMPCGGSCACH